MSSDRKADVEVAQAERLYGEARVADLRAMLPVLIERIDAVVDRFFELLVTQPVVDELLHSLGAQEQLRLKTFQKRHLLLVASPELDAAGHQAEALRVGRHHAVIGVDHEGLMAGLESMLVALRGQIDSEVHARAMATLGLRLIRDASLQMQALQNLAAERHGLMLDLTALVPQTGSYADLITRVVARLAEHEEITACLIGRINDEGMYQPEATAGEGMDERVLEALEQAVDSGMSATGRAWETGQITRIINLANHEPLARWAPLLLERGYRSSAAVPIGPPGGPPSLVLSLFCRYPGGFSSLLQQTFLGRLQGLLSLAVASIEHREGRTQIVPHVTRKRWAALLRTDALEMHYQPLLEVRTGRITKVEALARLSVDGGVLAPGEFFSALLPDDFVEMYVNGLTQVLAQWQRWQKQGGGLDVSINLPSSALVDERYYEITRRLLAEHACPPGALTLELLETEQIEIGAEVAEAFEKFRALGVELAEDDLGAGYSGLQRLREMPFDLIKIDRSIVRNVRRDDFDVLRFIYQLTRLGHVLGKKVAVEGIEDADLLEVARVLGVDYVQGWAIARPMPAAQLDDWLQQNAFVVPPAHGALQSHMARLARLLVWEELLHLRLETVPVMEMLLQDDPLNMAFHLVTEGSPMHLVESAFRHGMGSVQYLQARQALLEELRRGSLPRWSRLG